jgi:glutamate formiminotransferase/glutamate formiminotransferase/formiminotetrahydrofolate cyclodeaminase
MVGARPPLIAYNVNLETRDLAVAKAIAKIVRFSSGGLPHLKAIGVELASRGMVQVSMNLTNFEKTPIHVAFEAVRREAEQRGVPVSGSEIIGLVPQRALLQSSQYFLKLEGFDPTLVLETRLEMALGGEATPQGEMSKGMTGRKPAESGTWDAGLSSFLEEVAAGTPTPGGGSVAALAGALAAALGVMACRVGLPSEQKQLPEVSPPTGEYPAQMSASELSLESVKRRLLEIGEELRRLIRADAEAYAGVVRAYRLPKTDSSRSETISTSLQAATEVPLETASLASEAGILLRKLLSKIKPAVASDLKVGLLLATTAIEAALENAVENLKVQKNQRLINDCSRRIAHIRESLVELKRL